MTSDALLSVKVKCHFGLNHVSRIKPFATLSLLRLHFVLFLFLLFTRGGSGGLNVKTQPESRCPELLANFCDMLLRKTPYSKKLTSDEIQAKLKDVVSSP